MLNSLTGEGFIEASLACLARGGRFVELARRDILSEGEMAALRPDVAYSILDLYTLKQQDPAGPGAALEEVLARIATGELAPLRHTTWPLAETSAAMDYMRAARHIGKIVLTTPPIAEGRLRRDGTYLVTGGLGGIGLALAAWLAERGAGSVVLNSRRGAERGGGAGDRGAARPRVQDRGGDCGRHGHGRARCHAGADRRGAAAARRRHPQRRRAVGRRLGEPELGELRDGCCGRRCWEPGIFTVRRRTAI